MAAPRTNTLLQRSQVAFPAVICVAPNGARRGKEAHPRLPMTKAELANDAARCMQAGASAIHLHVRDAAGRHSLDVALYRDVVDEIRAATDGKMVIQITTESCGIYPLAQQITTVQEVRPEAASVAIREIVPDGASIPAAERFFHWARERGIGLQYVIYDAADAARAVQLQRDGVIPDDQPHVLFVLGRYSASQTSDPADLYPFLSAVPDDWPWSVCAFGRPEAECMQLAIEYGGNVRVGFENNLVLPDGSTAVDNAELVANVSRLVVDSGRRLGSVQDARALYVG